jgi:heme-degrading monooxygenase HmoA
MFARVETFQAQSGDLDEVVATQNRTVGLVRTMNGNMGGYVLVDSEAGHVMNVTFWQSEDDRDAAEGEFAAAGQRGDVGLFAIAMQEALRTA